MDIRKTFPRTFQTASAAAIALALAACATTTTYPAQSSAQAGLLSAEQVAAQYQVDGSWWQIYGDEQLNRLIQTALQNNIDLRQAAVTAEKARYSANEAGASLLPEGSGSVGASSSKNIKSGGASTRSFSSQIGLSYELDVWQKVRATADAAAWEYRATQQDLAAARLTLANSVADAYFHLAYLDEAIGLTEKSIGQYSEIARIARAQHKVGKVAGINPDQAEQSLLSAKNSLNSLQQERNTVLQTLRNLLNLRPADKLDITPVKLASLPETQVDLNVPLTVLAARPDIRAAEYRVQKAYAAEQAAKRSWLPSITLGAALQTGSGSIGQLFSVPVGVGSVAVNLPFLNWPTLHWQTKSAEADFDSAKLSFEQTLTTALNEVDTYYRQYTLSRSTLANAQKKYAYDQKISRYYRVRYQYGANPLSDWLDALNTELSSAQTVLNNRYTVLQNENLVYQAMAGRYTAK